MPRPIYYVGAPAEVAHHARPLMDAFDVRIEEPENVVRHAQPGDVCLFFNEFLNRFRVAHHELMRKRCATLYAIDGILEWRSMWEFPGGDACLWTGRPILSHKIACVGRSQARIFESWGHARECELVGIPRFDALLGRSPRTRAADEPFTILVLTAKWPGFTEEQVRRASLSLKDLKSYLERNPTINGVAVKSIWRITQGLEAEVGVDNTLKDTTGQDLAAMLQQVDAVVTTPSTAMLEGMLQGVPVALLDYNNCPHYVPAAWRSTANDHFDQVIPELVSPPPAKLHYQQHLLHDGLECTGPARPRLVELIERMDSIAKRAAAEGTELSFPARLLSGANDPIAADAIPLDHDRVFPDSALFAMNDTLRLQLEVNDLRQAMAAANHKIAHQRDTLEWVEHQLAQKGLRQKVRRFQQKAGRAVRRLVNRSNDPNDEKRAA
jgi:hypothetical protein